MPMHNAMPMQLLVASDATSADLHIMGNITTGSAWFGKKESDTDAQDIVEALTNLPDTCERITVHINSMGGDVAQGVAIYNALKAHKGHVTTVCEGFACSIASVVFMAGDERVMRNASLLMIHEAWTFAQGNSAELRKAADDLEVITELSKRAYMEHANDSLTREELDRLMDEETWILPEQALGWGLATSVDAPDAVDAPEQNAMQAVMRRLTEPESVAKNQVVLAGTYTQVMTEAGIAELAQGIADQVILELTEKVIVKVGERPVDQPDAQAEEPDTQKSFMQRAALMYAD